jgi:hypothetical protein
MKPIEWDIRREGRRWSHEEFDQRMHQAPEKIVKIVPPLLLNLIGDGMMFVRATMTRLTKMSSIDCRFSWIGLGTKR